MADELLKTLLLLLDLSGTFVFALSGAMAGIKRRLDLFGVLVLSFAASSFGGISRDLLIGATPPAALKDWRYLVVSFVAGLKIRSASPARALTVDRCRCCRCNSPNQDKDTLSFKLMI